MSQSCFVSRGRNAVLPNLNSPSLVTTVGFIYCLSKRKEGKHTFISFVVSEFCFVSRGRKSLLPNQSSISLVIARLVLFIVLAVVWKRNEGKHTFINYIVSVFRFVTRGRKSLLPHSNSISLLTAVGFTHSFRSGLERKGREGRVYKL